MKMTRRDSMRRVQQQTCSSRADGRLDPLTTRNPAIAFFPHVAVRGSASVIFSQPSIFFQSYEVKSYRCVGSVLAYQTSVPSAKDRKKHRQ